jgi:hypothetical protein
VNVEEVGAVRYKALGVNDRKVEKGGVNGRKGKKILLG